MSILLVFLIGSSRKPTNAVLRYATALMRSRWFGESWVISGKSRTMMTVHLKQKTRHRPTLVSLPSPPSCISRPISYARSETLLNDKKPGHLPRPARHRQDLCRAGSRRAPRRLRRTGSPSCNYIPPTPTRTSSRASVPTLENGQPGFQLKDGPLLRAAKSAQKANPMRSTSWS